MSDNGHQLKINIIDSDTKHDNGFLQRERTLHPGYISCHDVKSMVHNIKLKAGARKIAVLRIFGHGHEGSQRVGGGQRGNDSQRFWIDDRGRLHHRDLLSLLSHHFTHHGIVQLHGCEVADTWKGKRLLKELAHLWHCRVMAAVKEQHAHSGGIFDGTYIEMDGSVHRVPVEVDHAQ